MMIRVGSSLRRDISLLSLIGLVSGESSIARKMADAIYIYYRCTGGYGYGVKSVSVKAGLSFFMVVL